MVLVSHKQLELHQYAQQRGVNLRLINGNALGVSLDETTTAQDVDTLLSIFAQTDLQSVRAIGEEITKADRSAIPQLLKRTSEFLTHPTFNRYHS